MKVSAPFSTTRNRAKMQIAASGRAGRLKVSGYIFKNYTKKYWNCMRYSVIMSLSCIVRCIVNYNYSENSLIK